MPFQKGKKKTGGRKRGQPNHTTTSIKEAFLEAFTKLGGVDSLVEWGKENKTDFYKLATKLIPVEVTGKDGADLVQSVEVTIIKSK
jgi:hypothetical protein